MSAASLPQPPGLPLMAHEPALAWGGGGAEVPLPGVFTGGQEGYLAAESLSGPNTITCL